ncbi:MAG: NAD(P)H-dependent glycerol-3-phosphate dehydrogenase [Bacillota bacterium]|nr:NAD(P)H-dependent glycerol-3-phosphate dehydrogenase [Bacillota bacterium]MDW7676462.1 NAD(P)H-dependent glycerol-3-phosphate dehydrogenase [Bacillota bacterium]
MKQNKVAILGAGSWGTAISTVMQLNGHQVRLWMRNEQQMRDMIETRKNQKYLPEVLLSEEILFDLDMPRALGGVQAVILAVPTQQVRALLKEARDYIPRDALIINVAKGIEKNSYYRISEIVNEELGNCLYAVVSGPSHAEEVARRMPTTLVAASRSQKLAEQAQDLFMNPFLRVYTNPDVVGVELAGALKNVIAFGAGIADGIGYGDNARAALITRGITEIARLGQAMGASLNTFAGLTGIGDLIVTCTSMHSRNRRAGILIGRGKSLDEALKQVGMVVEGVCTASAAYELAKQHGIDMPITSAIHRVLYESQNVAEAVKNLMTRQRKHEMEEVAASYTPEWLE